MRRLYRKATELAVPLVRRGGPVLFAYLTTSLVLVVVIALLSRALGPDRVQAVLLYVFIATLAAGIEPGTAKAALIRHRNAEGIFAMTGAMYRVSVVKAVVLSPLFAGVWWLSQHQPAAPPEGIWLTPLVVSLGFVATDLRVALDARGRHAAAIWLKQGSLMLAIAVAAAVHAAGADLTLAIGIACVARLLWTAAFVCAAGTPVIDKTAPPISLAIRDKAWRDLLLASVLGAVAGSVDRFVAFRMLSPEQANAYVLVYEILTKFWLLPYLMVPIIFVSSRRDAQSHRFVKMSYLLIGFAAVPFLLFAAALPLLPLAVMRAAAFDASTILVFAAAVVVNSFSMLMSGQLQGAGNTRGATISTTGGLMVAAVAFPLFVHFLGIAGIFWAWLVKSSLECALFRCFFGRKYRVWSSAPLNAAARATLPSRP